MDPRVAVIDKRLDHIDRIIAVSGGKGGIGKSSVASMLALTLTRMGRRVGIFDLDFCGPSQHVILGIKGAYPEEKQGIVPPTAHGMKFMSIVFYAGDEPSPLRGDDLSNAIIELLSITQWGTLDFLIVDMPPGIGDTTLDAIRLVKRAQFLNVSTPSRLAFETVKKVLYMQKELAIPTIGVIENMKRKDSRFVADEVRALNIPFLGSIAFDDGFENALGNVEQLVTTQFADDLMKIVQGIAIFHIQEGG